MLFLEGSRSLGKGEHQRPGGQGAPEDRTPPQESPSSWLCTLGKPETPTFCFLSGLGADSLSGLYFSCSGLWVQPQLRKKKFPGEMRLPN